MMSTELPPPIERWLVERNWYVMLRNQGKQCAVYLLLHDGIPVYIGYTSNLWSRMRDHIQQGKEWNGLIWNKFETPQDARAFERECLESCNELPKYNRSRTH
jgi:hypothetical protein